MTRQLVRPYNPFHLARSLLLANTTPIRAVYFVSAYTDNDSAIVPVRFIPVPVLFEDAARAIHWEVFWGHFDTCHS
jgi:hypothetical protein